MSNLIGAGVNELMLGSLKGGIMAAMPVLMKIFTFIILFITYPATPFIFILNTQLKQLKYIFYKEREL